MKEYRKLSAEEIALLEAAACTAEDWNEVEVAEGFDARCVRNVNFSGKIRLGSFGHIFELPGGVRRKAGIENACLHNVSLGDGCLVRNVNNYIANYEIGDRCFIENVGVMAVDRESSFGNGVRVSVLNETGGREVTISERLSSQLAYVVALYRHRPEFITKVEELSAGYADSVRSATGSIGNDTRIVNVQYMSCVRVGEYARIEGAAKLVNGSIVSKKEAPTYIGNGVICTDFIVCSDSRIEDGVMMNRCFGGQACRFGHGYSASDSLFFCNCQGENGEACAIFAGPYTVTHHKSTLLIAGVFSFMNAGSGSNQSNHMYKLGPIHQGTLERGAKTASDSYILWPSRVGAFSLVMGRHVNNPDTSNLPFSYLIEQQGVTYIIPGVNLKSVGTVRDVRKWPSRDRRKDPHRLDHINFNHLSPFTVQKMFDGIRILEMLKEASGNRADNYYYKKSIIRNASLHKGLKYYQTGIIKFLGNSFITRIQDADVSSDEGLRRALRRDNPVGAGHWLDISGLICPASEIEKLCDDLTEGKVRDLVELGSRFGQIASDYYSYEWTWAYDAIEKFWGYDLANITRSQAIDLISQWKNAVISLDKLIYDDAGKEFELTSMTGFGVDGDKVRRDADFTAVRGGGFNENPFVLEVLDHMRRKGELGDRMIARLGRKK